MQGLSSLENNGCFPGERWWRNGKKNDSRAKPCRNSPKDSSGDPLPLVKICVVPLNCRSDPDAAAGHAPAHHPRPLLRGYRVHTLLCRGSGLPVHFLVSPANCHDAPFARPLLELAVRLYPIRPRIIRLDAAYWGLQLIHWIHATDGEPLLWCPGIPSDKRTARVCHQPGPKTNWANAVPLSASLAVSSSSFVCNGLHIRAGRASCGKWP